jgi:hypothetical protein
MRGVVVAASVTLFLGACSWTNGGTAGMPAPGSVGPDQARQIIAAYGYGDIGPIGQSRDSGDWETHAVIDGVPYIVNVDHNGLVTAR